MKMELCAGVVAVDADNHVGIIHASNKKQWVLPKGHNENDEDLRETALREAMEEMGVGGILEPGPPVITSHYSKTHYDAYEIDDDANPNTRIQIPACDVIACKVTYFYRLTVLEVCEREDQREMLWIPPMEALTKLDYPSHRYVVRRLLGIGAIPIHIDETHQLALQPAPDVGADVPGGGAV